jgi:hypothetical protein
VSQQIERDPAKAKDLLTALAGNVQWIADNLKEKQQ